MTVACKTCRYTQSVIAVSSTCSYCYTPCMVLVSSTHICFEMVRCDCVAVGHCPHMTVLLWVTVQTWLCCCGSLSRHGCVAVGHCPDMTVLFWVTVQTWLCCCGSLSRRDCVAVGHCPDMTVLLSFTVQT